MLKRLLVSAALVGSALIVPAAVAPVHAATAVVSAPAVAMTAACTYRRAGASWRCITPGAYCPAAAHGKAGYAKVTNRRYKCSIYPNGQWRWKRV